MTETNITSPSQSLALHVGDLAFEKKAEDVVILDIRGISDAADFFVICTGGSNTHVRAISDHISMSLKAEGDPVHHQEGYESLEWVLLDFIDVVVHVMQQRKRSYYDLERLWGDAPRLEVEAPAESSSESERL